MAASSAADSASAAGTAASPSPATPQTRIGATVRETRTHYMLTQQQLAELVGTSDRTIREIEQGTGRTSLSTVVTVLETLGLRLEALG